MLLACPNMILVLTTSRGFVANDERHLETGGVRLAYRAHRGSYERRKHLASNKTKVLDSADPAVMPAPNSSAGSSWR